MSQHILLDLHPYIVPLLLIGRVALRLIRNKPRKVKPNRLFVLPLILTFGTLFTLSQTPAPGLLWFAIYIVAAALGTGIGYLSGRHREFTLDPDRGEIMSRATPVGTIIFGALFAVRFGLKLAFPQLNGGRLPSAPPPANLHPAGGVIGWTDAGLVFSTAMLLSTAATTWWRTRQLTVERPTTIRNVGDTSPPG